MNNKSWQITTTFNILDSHDISDEITEISPDIAVCKESVKTGEDMQEWYNWLSHNAEKNQ